MERQTFTMDQNPPPYTPWQTNPRHASSSYQQNFGFMGCDPNLTMPCYDHRPQSQTQQRHPSQCQNTNSTYQQPWEPSYQTGPSARLSHSPPSQPQHQYQSYSPIRSQRPCVIPQITKVFGGPHMSPFARPRVQELETETGLSERELLNFIDGLNEAFMANPALQATSQVGMVVGFVPLATTQIIGSCLEAAAGLGSAGVSIVRTKQYLKKVNHITFGPRGLCARVVKTEKMLSLIGVGGAFSSDQYSALVGRQSSDGADVSAMSDPRTDNPDQMLTQMQSPLEKRMALLGDRVMRLSFDNVASPAEGDNWMKKWGAYSVQKAEQKQLKQLKEKETKQSRKSEKVSRKAGRKGRKTDNEIADITDEIDDLQYQMQTLDLSQRKDIKTGRELRRDLRRLERKLAELEEDREYDLSRKSSKGHKKETRRNEKETKKINKLYWIVILTADQNPPGEEHDLESEEEEQAVIHKTSRS